VALRAEIAHNLEDYKQMQPGLKLWRAQIDADLQAMQRIQEHPGDPKAQHASMSINSSSVTMTDTAWKTAQMTGALAYMPYEEAERYSDIYKMQDALLALQQKPMEEVANANGLIVKFHCRPDRLRKYLAGCGLICRSGIRCWKHASITISRFWKTASPAKSTAPQTDP
jgi:hypothetical protein